MPNYDFECSECGYKLEKIVGFNYPKITECPKCKKKSFIRLIGRPNFKFIGEGFYENDKKINNAIKENNIMKEEKKQRSIDDPDY